MSLLGRWLAVFAASFVVFIAGCAKENTGPRAGTSAPPQAGTSAPAPPSAGNSETGSWLASALPDTVGGSRKSETIGGAAAMEATRRLHKGSIVTAVDAAIASYEGGLTIWLTRYKDETTAIQQLDAMAKAMERFGGGFEKLSTSSLKGETVYVTQPKGEAQYFWRKGESLAYIVPGKLDAGEFEQLVEMLNKNLTNISDTR